MYERKNKRRPLPIVNKTIKQGKEDIVLKKKKNCICRGLKVGAESPCMEICCVTPPPPLPSLGWWFEWGYAKINFAIYWRELKLVENIKI